MILRRLVVGGDPQLGFDLHPRLTVLRGLGPADRARIAAAVASLLGGDPGPLGGTVEVDGVEFDIEPDLVYVLDLASEPPDIVIRAADLKRVAAAADENTVTTGNRRAELDEALDLVERRFGALAARRTEVADIVDLYGSPNPAALESDEPADGDDVQDERGLAGTFVPDREGWSWTTPDPAAPAAPAAHESPIARRIDELETEIAEVRRRLAEVDALHDERAASTDTDEPRWTSDSDLSDEHTDQRGKADRTAVSAALEAFQWVRSWRPDVQPEAVALAEQVAAIRRDKALARPTAIPEWLREQARQRLDEARADLERAEREVRPQRVAPEAAAALEAAHAAVDEAEERARRRMAGPMANRRVVAARAQEEEILQRLGLPSYAAYLLLRASSGNVDADGERRLADARAALADAEAMWDEANGGSGPDGDSQDLRAQERAVRAAALEVLGSDAALAVSEMPLERLEVVLREQRMPGPDWRPAAEGLAEAMAEAGVELPPLAFDEYEGDYDRLEELAAAWLAGGPAGADPQVDEELHAAERMRAALLDDLEGLESELADLREAAAAMAAEVVAPGTEAVDPFAAEIQPAEPFPSEPSMAEPFVAEAPEVPEVPEAPEVAPVEVELIEVEADDEPAVAAAAEIEAEAEPADAGPERIDRPMTATERLRALREQTDAKLDALAFEVGSLVRDVDVPATGASGLDEAGEQAEVAELAELETEAAELAAEVEEITAEREALEHESDDRAVEVGNEIDAYLAERFGAVRALEIGVAAPLPMLVDDAFIGLPPGVADVALGRIADESEDVQVVMMSDDPEVSAWAAALGEVGVDAAIVEFGAGGSGEIGEADEGLGDAELDG